MRQIQKENDAIQIIWFETYGTRLDESTSCFAFLWPESELLLLANSCCLHFKCTQLKQKQKEWF